MREKKLSLKKITVSKLTNKEKTTVRGGSDVFRCTGTDPKGIIR